MIVSDKVYAYPCTMFSFILDSWFDKRNLILPSLPQIAPTPHFVTFRLVHFRLITFGLSNIWSK